MVRLDAGNVGNWATPHQNALHLKIEALILVPDHTNQSLTHLEKISTRVTNLVHHINQAKGDEAEPQIETPEQLEIRGEQLGEPKKAT